MYQNFDSPYLKQLQDILNTYIVYNFDLGREGPILDTCVCVCVCVCRICSGDE
jgi:hypothetical protein